MTTPFIGEIQVFGFNFAPINWAQCNGALLALSQYTALFSLIGTYYGGNGTTTFQLPNLQGRAACGQGQGPGLTLRTVGDTFGTENVALALAEMPAHTHGFTIFNQPDATKRSNVPATGNGLNIPSTVDPFPATTITPNTTFSPQMLGSSGQGLPHENRQPALAINYCIALAGAFPSFG